MVEQVKRKKNEYCYLCQKLLDSIFWQDTERFQSPFFQPWLAYVVDDALADFRWLWQKVLNLEGSYFRQTVCQLFISAYG